MGYYPQESLYKHYKYHGYTVRGTPNCPLIHIFDFQDQDVFIFCRPGMWICLCVLFQGKGEEKIVKIDFLRRICKAGVPIHVKNGVNGSFFYPYKFSYKL